MKLFSKLAVLLLGVSVTAPSGATAKQSSIVHSGEPVGEEVTYEGVTLYVSKPPSRSIGAKKRATTLGVLFLTDIYGIQLNENKLLVDSFAREGFVAVAPDLFDGSPAPVNASTPGYNQTEFFLKHTPEVTDPIVTTAISYLRGELGIQKIAASGYCYGGRYAFRVLDGEDAVDVGFAAHPSRLTTEEIQAVQRPVTVASAETDNVFPLDKQAEAEVILSQVGQPFTSVLYSGTTHGFAVRANLSDPQQKFAKEEAFYQAVRFFNAWA